MVCKPNLGAGERGDWRGRLIDYESASLRRSVLRVQPRCWSSPCAILLLALAAISLPAQEASESDTLTVEDVRRFLDPTVMINRFQYQFQANYLPGDVRISSHVTRPFVALNSRSAMWLSIPWINIALPDGSGHSGIGDLSIGGGYVVNENLASRLTAVAAGFEVFMPTGDPAIGTGGSRWILQGGGAVYFNPTDLFPVYLSGGYRHSIADGDKPGSAQVRTITLNVQTFHILPKRFFLAFIPSLFVDLARDQTAFTFAIGAGRAMSRRLALQASYVQYLLGSETFSRGFQLGLTYFWGPDHELQ